MPKLRITEYVVIGADASPATLRITQSVLLVADTFTTTTAPPLVDLSHVLVSVADLGSRQTLRLTHNLVSIGTLGDRQELNLSHVLLNIAVGPTTTTTTSSTTAPPPQAQVQKALGYAVLTVPDGAVVQKALAYAVLEATTTTTTSTTSTTTSTTTTTTAPPPEWIVEDVVITFVTTTTTTTLPGGCWVDDPFNNLNEWSVAGDGSWQVLSGKFEMSTISGGDITATSSWQCVSGVFDVEIDFNLTTTPASDDWSFAFRYYIDSTHYAEIDASLRTTLHNKYFYTTYRNGGGVIENSASRSSDYGKLRIRREATGSVKLYYQDGAGSWVLLTTITNINSTDVGVIQLLGTSWDNDPTAAVEWDNFTVTEGCSNFQYPPTTTTTTSSSTTGTTITYTGPPPSTTTTTTSTTTSTTAPPYTGVAYGTKDAIPTDFPATVDLVEKRYWHEWVDDDGGRVRSKPIGTLDSAAILWPGEVIHNKEIKLPEVEDEETPKYFLASLNRYEYTTCTPSAVGGFYRTANFNSSTGEFTYGTWIALEWETIYSTTDDWVQFKLFAEDLISTTSTTV